MKTENLSDAQRNLRMNIRNFFLIATLAELQTALSNYPDTFSQACIQELIDEKIKEDS